MDGNDLTPEQQKGKKNSQMSEQFCAYVSKCIKLNLNFRMRMFSKFYIHFVWIILAALLKVLFKLLLVGIFFFSWDNAIQTWFTNPYCRFCGIFGVWEQKKKAQQTP